MSLSSVFFFLFQIRFSFFFCKIISRKQCQFWTKIGLNKMPSLIWVLTVRKGSQQMALVEFISISIVNFKSVPFTALEDLGTRIVSRDHKLKGSVVVDFLFIVTPIVGVCNCSMFCCTLLILMGKKELIALLNLYSWCLVMVERPFLAVPRGCLQFVIVVFPDHFLLLFIHLIRT